MGCGTGRLTRSYACLYPAVLVIGIDPCAEMINHAAASTTAVRWLQARAEQLRLSKHLLSLGVSTPSLRRRQNPHQGQPEISRITALDGTVVIADALSSPPTPR
ncbi:class I SAM-dependent methyltransferase [Streptomyces sp. NPDC091281]|uniref:class I SAM-dependent methyltransferase n=1 Tax=Streptomyces sp. NPDC091281 TaxID=3365985 RepID=UPI003808FA4B